MLTPDPISGDSPAVNHSEIPPVQAARTNGIIDGNGTV
jgi:hypothetical protein